MTDRAYHEIANQWIALADGTRLAARIWMPDDAPADPVPAVLEFLPYRKSDGTSQRDESTYPVFAAAGIAGVRVDIRGTGESYGVMDGEYTPLELSNAVEVIAWIAAQPWCNGSVGMMGISWGGFNCLQVAALRPPALRAVISNASSVDRYNDDIHYKNGTHLYANLSWAGTMLAYASRAPDPALVGAGWKNMWLDRLAGQSFFLEEWLAHQRRDGFWQHGSICETYDSFDVPALMIAGWSDGYRNTPFKALTGIGGATKAVVGPWIHKYPHFAWPKPRMDFHAEAIAWWNRWLRDDQNGAETLPPMRAYIQDGVKPAPWRDRDPGFWVAKDTWGTPDMQSYGADAGGRLVPFDPDGPGAATDAQTGDQPRIVALKSPLDCGVMAGEWFTLKPDAELPQDQRADDAGSLAVETAPLGDAIPCLGQATLHLRLSCADDWANLCARIVDVHPDGTATRVSFGVHNLAHRASHATPQAMPDGMVDICLTLDAMGYRFGADHRIRLAISTSYWPTILPAPTDPGVNIDMAALRLDLPLLGAHRRVDIPEPANPNPLPQYIAHDPPVSERKIERDLSTARTTLRMREDTGANEHPTTGMITRQDRQEIWSITRDDPTSMTGETAWVCDMARGDWQVSTRAESQLSCTQTEWIIAGRVRAYEGETLVYDRTFGPTRIARDFM